MNSRDMMPPHFRIPRMPHFLDEDVSIELTPESIRLYHEGRAKQGYIVIAELPDPAQVSEDQRLIKIHLVPAFNKDDGQVDGLNKYGKKFTRYIKSTQALGNSAGDLHNMAVSALGLGQKGGANGLIMGFGLWKGGMGIRFLSNDPEKSQCLPNEYLIVRRCSSSPWRLCVVEQNFSIVEVDLSDTPELEKIIEQLPETIDQQTLPLSVRESIENLIRISMGVDQEETRQIGLVKNRSASQNLFSCEIDHGYAQFSSSQRSRRKCHSLTTKRELPFSVFQRYLNAICDQLNISRIDLDNSSAVPSTGSSNLRNYFQIEKRWMGLSMEDRRRYQFSVAMEEGDKEQIELLWRDGADLNQRDIDHFTPLNCATRFNHVELVEWLLLKGVELNVEDNLGGIPLHYAIAWNNLHLLELLLARGANPDFRNRHDISVIFYALMENFNVDIIEMLLKYGADPDLQDNEGLSPYQFAVHRHNTQLIELFSRYRYLSDTDLQAKPVRTLLGLLDRRAEYGDRWVAHVLIPHMIHRAKQSFNTLEGKALTSVISKTFFEEKYDDRVDEISEKPRVLFALFKLLGSEQTDLLTRMTWLRKFCELLKTAHSFSNRSLLQMVVSDVLVARSDSGTVLHEMVIYGLGSLNDLFALADQTPAGLLMKRAISQALMVKTGDGRTALQLIAQLTPAALSGLLPLVDGSREGELIQEAIVSTLTMRDPGDNQHQTALHWLARNRVNYVSTIIRMVLERPALLDVQGLCVINEVLEGLLSSNKSALVSCSLYRVSVDDKKEWRELMVCVQDKLRDAAAVNNSSRLVLCA